jgi:uncharacterized protein
MEAGGASVHPALKPVAIPCPGCGREYDVTLFQFGRTISCTCGSRVGLEKRVGPAPRESAEGAPSFLTDAMLGRLARSLRALGYDTVYDPVIEDGDAVRRAVDEGRILLTRDRALPVEWRIEGVVVVEAQDLEGQLREVDLRVGLALREGALFSRCLRCNTPLEPLSGEEPLSGVPFRVRREGRGLRWCPSCEQAFWQGSHTDRMRRRFERVVGRPDEGG